MILHKVTVSGMRCFRNPVTVGPFGKGLNLIFAPNESGKSTLVEAVGRALFDRYSVGGQEIEAIRPWGTSLCPDITLEFEHDGEMYHLAKRFLDDPMCELSRIEDGESLLIAERDSADDFLRDLLHGDRAGRGLTDLSHWGLARTLWSLQGPEDQHGLQVSSTVAAQFRSALPGQPIVTSRLDLITSKLEDMYTQYFTSTGRKRTRQGAPLHKLEEEIADIEQKVTQAKEAHDQVQQASQNLQELIPKLAGIEEERAECLKHISSYEQQARELEAIRANVNSAEKEANRAKEEFKKVSAELDRYEDAAKRSTELEQELNQLDEQLQDVEVNLKAIGNQLEDQNEELSEAQTRRQQADEARTRARRINAALELSDRAEQLTEKANRLDGLLLKLDNGRKKLREMPTPDAEEIDKADKLADSISQLVAQLRVAGLQLSMDVHRDQLVEISGGDKLEKYEAQEGKEITYTAGATLQIRLQGVADIEVHSGAEEPVKLEESLVHAEDELEQLLTHYSVDSVRGLQELQLSYERQETELEQIRQDIERTAKPYADVSAVRDARAEARQELKQLLTQLDMTEDELDDIGPSNETVLEDAYEQAESEEQHLSSRVDDLRRRLREGQQEKQKLQSRRNQVQREFDKQQTIMEQILAGADCANIDELKQLKDHKQEALRRRNSELETLRAQLPSEEADPERLLETQEEALKDIQMRKEQLQKQQTRYELEIDKARSEGHYETLAQLEEELEAKRRRLHKLKKRAQAVKLLRFVLRGHRESSVSKQLPQLETAIARMMRAITKRERPVQVGSGFGLSGFKDEATGDLHEIEELSAGAREQLTLVARIALAEAYAEEFGRTMMVLDDVLLYTDPARHDRVKEIVKIAAQSLQIFLLTSHEDRYRGLVEPEYQFDLLGCR